MIVSARETRRVLLAAGRKRELKERSIGKIGAEDPIGFKDLPAEASSSRRGRLTEIKSALAGDRYQIDSYQIATKMLERHLVDAFCAEIQ